MFKFVSNFDWIGVCFTRTTRNVNTLQNVFAYFFQLSTNILNFLFRDEKFLILPGRYKKCTITSAGCIRNVTNFTYGLLTNYPTHSCCLSIIFCLHRGMLYTKMPIFLIYLLKLAVYKRFFTCCAVFNIEHLKYFYNTRVV